MCSEIYNEWVSIFDDEFKNVWQRERPELRKISMIYCAFQVELDKLKSHLNEEVLIIKAQLRKKDFEEKRKRFAGLAQSEKFDINFTNKENETPPIVSLNQGVEDVQSEEFFINSPSNHIKDSAITTLADTESIMKSPVLHKKSFHNSKKKKSTSPIEMKMKIPKIEEPILSSTPKNLDNSDIMECSIIEDTPEVKVEKNKSKMSRLQLKRSNKSKLNKSKQATTLTQLFFEPKQVKREIDSNMPSMTVTQMINLINESDSETDAESDATVDDLQVPSQHLKQICGAEPEKSVSGVNRKDEKKLTGWSCDDCKLFYEKLNLSPEQLQKKMDECAKHSKKFKPREETFDGFWNLTFLPSPKEDETSMELNYKKRK